MGECVLDFVKNDQAGDKGYRRMPGGCAVNVAIELARLIKKHGGGMTVFIVGRVGNDGYGRDIREALAAEGVNALHFKTDIAPTSTVHMDIGAYGQRRCAGRYNGADVNLCAEDIKDIALNGGDAVCITSGGFLNESGRDAHMLMLQKAAAAGALICFDLNIREGLWASGRARELLLPVIAMSDVIKIKGHELVTLFGRDDMAPLYETAKGGVSAVYTESERPCREIGMGDRLFAGIVFETVNMRKPPATDK